MIKEHDRVVLTRSIEEEGLAAGDVATVVHVYASGKGFEVEFFTLTGRTAAVATVPAEAVRPVRAEDRLHVRIAA